MWMFEQPIGFLNITVNIRMTVVKLADGGLLVYNPIAPTGECLRELEALGVVRHVVLGCALLLGSAELYGVVLGRCML